ncbi:unnamed protein product [Auanema sp. JU1783]|nr:unnamed protein product [Auanema sp. JU1783]
MIILTLVMGLPIAFEIIRTIHRKQSLMSTGASSHHLKVLKILTIQIVCTASLGVCVPFALIFSLFSPVNSTIIYGCSLLMGANSLALSLLTICLNPVSRKTALTLIGWYRPKRKTTIRVDAKDSTFVK